MAQPRDPSDPDFPHGTTFGYRLGDRCPECREAKREDWRRYKERQHVIPMEDFEGMVEPDQIASLVKDLVVSVRCECGRWHEASEECPANS